MLWFVTCLFKIHQKNSSGEISSQNVTYEHTIPMFWILVFLENKRRNTPLEHDNGTAQNHSFDTPYYVEFSFKGFPKNNFKIFKTIRNIMML